MVVIIMDSVILDHEIQTYDDWFQSYQFHLRTIYKLLPHPHSNSKIINYNDFCIFVYKNSSKYISQYL